MILVHFFVYIFFFVSLNFRHIDPLRDIGRGDLDPLGRGGGGMLFNPFHQNPDGILPRGPDNNPLPGNLYKFLDVFCAIYTHIIDFIICVGVIPGARFDPFGPLDPGRITRSGPSNDHFPPPGYDDMYL